MTFTFDLRSTSITPIASSSSDPSEMATNARGIATENYALFQISMVTLRITCLQSICCKIR